MSYHGHELASTLKWFSVPFSLLSKLFFLIWIWSFLKIVSTVWINLTAFQCGQGKLSFWHTIRKALISGLFDSKVKKPR